MAELTNKTGFIGNRSERRKCGKEIRIIRVSPMMHGEVNNIADHLGISTTDFLKTKLLDIISGYPAHYRAPLLKD